MREINDTYTWFLENINKIDKHLDRLNRKKERTYNAMSGIKDTAIESTHIRRILKNIIEHFMQYYKT